ncbi:unnamed protein product, partial [Ectocarpus sp. 4 AP-2014]
MAVGVLSNVDFEPSNGKPGISCGGALLLGLGMTHSVVSAGHEAVPVIRKGSLRR